MNIGTFVGIVLIAGIVLFGFNLIVNDFETSLIDTGYVNVTPFSSSYNTGLNQTTKISQDFNETITGLQSLGDEGEWWDKLGDFVGAIPVIIISFPKVVIGTLFDTIGNITIALDKLGIPPIMVGVIGVGFIIWIIFKLINFWKSGKEI